MAEQQQRRRIYGSNSDEFMTATAKNNLQQQHWRIYDNNSEEEFTTAV